MKLNISILLSVLTSMILMSSSCSSKKEITKEIAKVSTTPNNVVKYGLQKGACFGSCPMYTLHIYADGKAVLDAKKFLPELGKFERQLSPTEFTKIEKAFAESDFYSHQDTFTSMIPDLPLIRVTYHNGSTSKTIQGREGRPASVVGLERMLDIAAMGKGWKLIESYEEKSKKKAAPGVIYNQLIVQPHPGKLTEAWLSKYKAYELKKVRKISPDLEYYVLGFSTKKIDPKKMLEMMQHDPAIRLVEFNKEMTLRDGR